MKKSNPPVSPSSKDAPSTPAAKPKSAAGSPPEPAERKGKSSTPPRQPSPGSAIGTLALLVALLAGGAAFYLWEQQRQATSQLAATEARLQRTLGTLEQQQQQHRQELQQLVALGQGQPDLQRHLEQLEQQLQALRAQLPRQLQEWELAEVDYLLRIAEHRLQLERQPAGALSALHGAAATLQAVNETRFAVLQEAIAADIQRIRAVADEDAPQRLSQRLDGLVKLVGELSLPPSGEVVDSLALPEALAPGQPEATGWRQFIRQVWADLRGLVVIRHQADEWLGPPAPGQQQNLQWLLLIKLETARLALLSGQPQAWQASLDSARQWLARHFDRQSTAWQQLDTGLAELAAEPVRSPLPSLQDTIRLLESLLLKVPPGSDASAPQVEDPA